MSHDEPFGEKADIESMLPRVNIHRFLFAREQIESSVASRAWFSVRATIDCAGYAGCSRYVDEKDEHGRCVGNCEPPSRVAFPAGILISPSIFLPND